MTVTFLAYLRELEDYSVLLLITGRFLIFNFSIKCRFVAVTIASKLFVRCFDDEQAADWQLAEVDTADENIFAEGACHGGLDNCFLCNTRLCYFVTLKSILLSEFGFFHCI